MSHDLADRTGRSYISEVVPSEKRNTLVPPAPGLSSIDLANERAERGSTPPVRAAELSQILSWLGRSSESASPSDKLVVVAGPSGMGKSRFLSEVRAKVRLSGGVVLEGNCEPVSAYSPFRTVIEHAIHFLHEVGIKLPSLDGLRCSQGCHAFWYQHTALANGHGHPPPEPQPASRPNALHDLEVFGDNRVAFFESVERLLALVATQRPTVLLLHDLELADRGTLELLASLLDARSLGFDAGSLVTVASLRSDAEPLHSESLTVLLARGETTRLELGYLDADGVRAYLQSDAAVERILARTGGHPDLIDRLLDAEPVSVADRVGKHIALLSPPVTRALYALAVYGKPATGTALEHLLQVPSHQAGAQGLQILLSELSDCGLIERSIEQGQVLLTFARDVERKALYDIIPKRDRIELHAKAVEVAVAEFDLTSAVGHAKAIGDFGRATELALVAANSLAAKHAHGEAACLLESLIDHTDGLGIRQELCELYRRVGEFQKAIGHAVRIANQEPTFEAYRRTGHLRTLAGEFDNARLDLQDAIAAGTNAKDRAVGQADLAEVLYQQGSFDEASELAQSALTSAKSADVLDVELQARNTLGKVMLARRFATQSLPLFETNAARAAEFGLGVRQAQAVSNIGVAHLLDRDFDKAEHFCLQAVEIASRSADLREWAIATENLAVLAQLKQDYRTAIERYREAIGGFKRTGNKVLLARAAYNLGELYLSLGEHRVAASYSKLAGQHFNLLPPVERGNVELLRGRVANAGGESGLARAHLDRALIIFSELDAVWRIDVELERASLALEEGRLGDVRKILAEIGAADTLARQVRRSLLEVELGRAEGEPNLVAAERAREIAGEVGGEEYIRALSLEAQLLIDAGRRADAARVLSIAEGCERNMLEAVPKECRDAFLVRAEARRLQTLLAEISKETSRASWVPVSHRDHHWSTKYPRILGSSPAISHVLALLDKVAPSETTVLIRGESGTGKELVAEAIHQHSLRAHGPMIKVNCAALVETLLLSELFGHEKGSFTGAVARKKGRFELAEGGTIFLDEIGDISAKTQVALLRVLQEREVERVGGTAPVKVNVRVLAATNRNLEQMVRDGLFREDLYYRLRGVTVEMPALRKRLSDLPDITAGILSAIAAERQEPLKSLSAEAIALLGRHRWPGNVRELENVLRSATLFSEVSVLSADDLSAFATHFEGPATEAIGTTQPIEGLVYQAVRSGKTSLFEMKKLLERECIERALEETSGNITKAAHLLGMKRPRLSQLVKEYGLAAKSDDLHLDAGEES